MSFLIFLTIIVLCTLCLSAVTTLEKRWLRFGAGLLMFFCVLGQGACLYKQLPQVGESILGKIQAVSYEKDGDQSDLIAGKLYKVLLMDKDGDMTGEYVWAYSETPQTTGGNVNVMPLRKQGQFVGYICH